MAAVSMENRIPDPEPLANATTKKNTDTGKLLPNSTSQPASKSSKSGKEIKRGKLSKALTLPSEACSPPTTTEPLSKNPCLVNKGPRPIPILPRTSQYEKHPLLQERSASGLSELEEFLLERDTPTSKTFPPREPQEEGRRVSDPNRAPQPPKLKLQPRGAQFERHPLLVKTSSGKSELEQLLLEKEKELEKKEKKAKKTKETKKIEIPAHKRLWIKKGISVEKAKSFEKTACLEKAKSIDLSAQNVSRARSLEEESSLEKVRHNKLRAQKTMDCTRSSVQSSGPSVSSSAGGHNNPSCSSAENMPSPAKLKMANAIEGQNPSDNPSCNPVSSAETVGNGTATAVPSELQDTHCNENKKRKLLDLALKPNLEWREDDQQFVMFVQSPVSPLEEKPDHLLICYEARTSDTNGKGLMNDPMGCNQQGCSQLKQLPPLEKPKKFVHPTVIDSDPDSEGMVCMDELEPLDFGASSPEPSPHKSPAKEKEDTEEEPLIAKTEEKEGKPVSNSEKLQEEPNQKVPVEAMSMEDRKRKLSLKRASLGQLEPRTEQYIQHPLLEEKDEEGRSIIEKLIEEKETEIREKEEAAAAAAAEQEEKGMSELDVEVESKYQPKASIKRVHFEKSDGPEIEELGKVDIEADPGSTNSTRSNGSKKKGFRGSKNNKSKDDSPEEEKLLNGDGDENEKDNKQKEEGKNKCCCIS